MKHLTTDRLKEKINCQLSTVNCYRFGFTLIELLIVVSILGITLTVATTSYLGFEKRKRIENAALEIKSQVRSVQNKAFSGDKGFGTSLCLRTSQLIGWYLKINESNNTSFEIAGDCSDGINEINFSPKTINLPKDVSVLDIKYGSDNTPTAANILFRPTDDGAKFFNASNTPPFLTGGIINETKLLGGLPQEPITIILGITGSSIIYEVVILSSGSVYEKKI